MVRGRFGLGVPFLLTFSAFLLYFLALPPLNLPFFIFFAPAVWFFLIVLKRPDLSDHSLSTSEGTFYGENSGETSPDVVRGTESEERPETIGEIKKDRGKLRKKGFFRSVGRIARSFYGQIYIAAFLFWGASVIWLPDPHPAIWVGWFALTMALAFFFPIYVGFCRTLVDRLHFPLLLTPALVWIATEWLRKHTLGGYTFSSMEHALYLKPVFIQTADLIGEYGTGAMIVLIGTAIGNGVWSFFKRTPDGSNHRNFIKSLTNGVFSLLWGGVVFGAMVGYGYYSINRVDRLTSLDPGPETKLALLQDGTCYQFPVSDELNRMVHQRYLALSRQAAATNPAVDLIVWPEGTFCLPICEFAPLSSLDKESPLSVATSKEENGSDLSTGLFVPSGMTQDEVKKVVETQRETLDGWIQSLGVPVLFGGTAILYGPDGMRVFNSAFWRTPDNDRKRYDKRQRVMFGEYLPFLEWLPKSFPLKTLCVPVSAGKLRGDIPVGDRVAMVSICYESCFPHFIRREMNGICRETGRFPDLLINVSNDAWFRGGFENELHRATYFFRAVENRRPYVAATHGGISLAIDPAGRILSIGKQGDSTTLPVSFKTPEIDSFALNFGLWIPPIIAWSVLGIVIGTCFRKNAFFRKRQRSRSDR